MKQRYLQWLRETMREANVEKERERQEALERERKEQA